MIEKKLSKMKMRTKSIPVRSSRKSLDSLLDDEANENTQCDERDVPHKKRRCLGTSETTDRGGSVEPLLDLDACIVCEVSDERVSRCCGVDCLLSFHGECLYAVLGSTSSSSSSSSEDVSNPFCPYCWLKIVALKSKTLREKTVEAEKAVCKYLDKEMKSRDEDITLSGDEIGNQEQSTDIVSDHELQGEKDGCSSKPDADQGKVGTGKVIDEVGASEKVATEKFQDAEDDETAKDQGTRILNTGAGKKREVSSFLSMQESFSAKEQDQVQQNEKRRRRGLKIIDSDISSKGSSNERNGEDVTEQVTSSVQVTSPSGRMRNQQATTKVVAKSKTVRLFLFLHSLEHQEFISTLNLESYLTDLQGHFFL
jgi:hypothetical protein